MKRVVLLVALLCFALAPAYADSIQGTITFSGGVTLDTSSAGTATMVTGWFNTVVQSSSLSAPNPAVNSAVTFTGPWSFNAGQAGLWTVGGYTFDLTSSSITCQNNATFCPGALVVDGIGTISGNGYDPTTMTWHFTTQDPSSLQNDRNVFSFSAAQQAVPEPSSMMLLGAGLSGLVGLRRRRSNKVLVGRIR